MSNFENSAKKLESVLDLASDTPIFWDFVAARNWSGVALTLDVIADRYEDLLRRAEAIGSAEFEYRRRGLGVNS